MKKTVLMLTDYYLPGYKAGGPIQTLSNIVDQMGDQFNFRVLTRDRDLGDTAPYPGIQAVKWQPCGNAEILYLPSGIASLFRFCRILMSAGYGTLYLNSLFSLRFSILPLMLLRCRLVSGKTVILAPRGECAESALSLKSKKKKFFLCLAKFLRLHDGLVWQASNQHEAADIVHLFGELLISQSIVIAPDLPKKIDESRAPQRKAKIPGKLNIAFVGRIVKMKNLDYALKVLSGLRGDVSFNIYGPIEDNVYWEECRSLMNILGDNVSVTYHGVVDHDNVCEQLAKNDLLLLPTLGENFGHVIIEALSVGCPVLISDRTLWRNLEQEGAGWDIPLEQPETFRNTLQHCVNMDANDYRRLSEEAFRYAVGFANSSDIVRQSIDLYQTTKH